MMVTVWGQFLDHDITETPQSKSKRPVGISSVRMLNCMWDGQRADANGGRRYFRELTCTAMKSVYV